MLYNRLLWLLIILIAMILQLLYNNFIFMDHLSNQINNPQLHQHDFAEEIKELVQKSSTKQNVQIKMIVVFMLVSFFTNLQYNSSNLFYMNPAFYCQGVEQKMTQQYACKRLSSCHLIDPETVTSQLHLYCQERSQNRVLIQTSSGIGSWIGLIFATIISDRRGRKFSFVFAVATMVIGAIVQYVGITQKIWVLLIFSQGICGFAGKAIYFNFLILSTRFLKKQLYETVSLVWLVMSGFTEMSISILNSTFESWRLLFYIYFIGNVVVVVLSVIILFQDPIFYFDSGRYDECKEIFRKISIENEENEDITNAKMRQIDLYIASKKQSNLIHQKQDGDFDLKQVLNCNIVTNVFILGLLGCFYNMAGSSLDLSIQSLQLSYNQNLFIVAASKIVGYLLAIYIMKIQKQRKRGFMISALICGISGSMFAFAFCTSNTMVETIVIIVLRIALCWNGNFYVRLKVDLFPEKYQATLIGIVEFITNFGKTLCPALTQLSIDNKINPIFAINILHITIGTFPIFLLIQEKVKLMRKASFKSTPKTTQDD